MNLIEAVKSVFTKYATFTGRARRSEYWCFVLFEVIVTLIISILGRFIDPVATMPRDPTDIQDVMMTSLTSAASAPSNIIVGIFELICLVPCWAVLTRRLHDTNRSGWLIVAENVLFIIGYALAFYGIVADNTAVTGIGGILAFAGAIVAIYILVVSCFDSQLGRNKYGDNPKGENLDSSNF